MSGLHRVLLLIGLGGLTSVLLLSIPGNPVLDVNLRQHQLAGMLLSHASVAAFGAAFYPRRGDILAALVRVPEGVWLVLAPLSSVLLAGTWMTFYRGNPTYAAALARESGPLEPLQAGLYVTGAWLAGLAAAASPEGGPRRLYRLARVVCVWLALEEVEYFGLVEKLVGGRIEGVWVRSLHDLIAVGVRVPGMLVVLAVLGGLGVVAAVWYVGPRCLMRQARGVSAVVALAAAGALVLSQVLDHDNRALDAYAKVLTYRLEEPCELLTAFLLNVALVVKVRERRIVVDARARRRGGH